MNINIKIELPQVWSGTFEKNEWNTINYIVGPNGSGKSLLSSRLKKQLKDTGYKVRLLSAERLAGLEKESYSYSATESTNDGFSKGFNIAKLDTIISEGENRNLAASAIVILKKRLDVRIKIEALLSDLFRKTIILVEEGGYLKPKIQNIDGGEEYGLKEQECHGLKEIISLLTFLYDDSNDCLIFDEPELHLHPQFQSFFLTEIRKIAGDPQREPGKKLFFIITHSPYFVDLRSLNELQHIIVCHNNNQMPTFIQEGDLNEQDKYVLKRFLPRFNTHHKQFFFSPNPVFVEGYTDQQIISLLFEKTGLNISASGSSVIDVGGKEELAVFYKLCQKLDIKCRIIADYDSFYRGKLREDVLANNNSIKEKFIQSGYGDNVSKSIGELERILFSISDELVKITNNDSDIKKIITKLTELYKEKDRNKSQVIDVVHLSLYRFKDKIIKTIPHKKDDIDSYIYKHKKYTNCIKTGNIFILPNGELEHFFKASVIDYLNITQKDKLFEAERDYIMAMDDIDVIRIKYKDLLSLLLESIPYINVDLKKHIRFTIMDLIQKVQNAVERGEVNDIVSLENNARVNYKLYNQIIECENFSIKKGGAFCCTIRTKKHIMKEEYQVRFTDKTTTREIKLEKRAPQ